MVDAVVKLVLKKLGELTIEEARLIRGVSGGIDDLKNDLGRMIEILRRDNRNDGGQRVQELRRVVFRLEDVIDEFLIMKYNAASGFLPVNVREKRRIGQTMESIRSEIRKILERDINHYSRTDVVAEAPNNNRREDAALVKRKEASAVGIEVPKRVLVELICSDGLDTDHPKVISVHGMGGLGKTTLVREVYNYLVVEKLFKKYAWIIVTQEYNINHLLKDLIAQICKDSLHLHLEPQNLENMGINNQLMEEVYKLLQEDGFLIVLDDVWSRVKAQRFS